ncbi:hypothetical protein R5R35_001044 [Gryllus longicercus]|uniref:pyridoxal 5'-phosphate synthase n=1 Tax=Gryllus longicercus TaxID=2509291 RepID=A0AAN9VH17_9ORTH|nr:Uncharacterized protein GBIM_19454 [Gryllus bimaculatus]
MSSSAYVDVGEMRKKYKDHSDAFTENDLEAKEPIGQFKSWFDHACKNAGEYEANAMILSTASKDGTPSCRPVLLKGFGPEGFMFFTNYQSRKARDLDENPKAALTFFWNTLQRVIRVEGSVEKVPSSVSEKYFHSRPRPSQIGACASNQSEVIAGRAVLIGKANELNTQYPEGTDIPCPHFWGGYLVVPHSVEFWQGQSDRLHDRIKFRQKKPGEEPDGNILHAGEGNWVFERLAP